MRFLRTKLGKGLFEIFIASLILDSDNFVEIVIAIFILSVGIINIMASYCKKYIKKQKGLKDDIKEVKDNLAQKLEI